MPEVWFFLVAFMVAMYFVLDGFDLGAAMVRPFVARTDEERARVFAAIGPYWDGNEVWLVAAGGTSLCVFPAAFASVFGGLYIPLFMVLWGLLVRGVSIEFRHLSHDALWVSFWDFTFVVSGAVLSLLFGVAVGNLLRGFPLGDDGAFELDLFSGSRPAVLDPYTLLVGVSVTLAFALQGAAFLAWKTDGDLGERAARLRKWLTVAVAVAFVVTFFATHKVRPELGAAFLGRPVGWLFVVASLVGIGLAFRSTHALVGFVGSSLVILGSALSLAVAAFPVLVFAAARPEVSIVASGEAGGLRIALSWWALGMTLVLGYYVTVFRIHRGKTPPVPEEAQDQVVGDGTT
jgi:cytochrome bd ubiquinol oxidase subunit II